MKRLLSIAAVIAISTAAFIPAQAMAQVNVNIVIGNAPPPVRYEVVPTPRQGYEWAPGYWNWNGRRHVWAAGHWERVRAGQHYQRPEWQQERDGWRLNRGGWKHAEHRDMRNDRDDEHDNHKGRGFCPPGHAKKGEC